MAGNDHALIGAVNRVTDRIAKLERRFDKPIDTNERNTSLFQGGMRGIAQQAVDHASTYQARMSEGVG